MTTVSGRVEKVYSKEYKPGKFMYSIKVNDTFYGVGGRKPTANEGDNVRFEASQNGKYWNVEGNVEILSAGEQASTPKSGVVPVANDRQAFEERKQDAIALQSARNTALTAADFLVRNGAIKLPTKQADVGDVLLALVDDLTDRYYNEVRGIYEGRGRAKAEQAPAAGSSGGEDQPDDDIPF